MLPGAWRLKKAADFKQVLQKGRKSKVGDLLFVFLPQDGGQIRVGLVVSKKISPSAVVRNRLRRLMTEIIRLDLKGKDTHPKGDLVIVFLQLPEEPIREKLEFSWRQWLKALS